MKTQHTAAPWIACDISGKPWYTEEIAIFPKEGSLVLAIATIQLSDAYLYNRTKDEMRANAHIIAAAPEMFDVLGGIISVIKAQEDRYKEDGSYYFLPEELAAIQRGHDAIRKAKGGEE
jgi:hypothetical protein